MTDPIVSWAMTKESIEELWIRRTSSCSANSDLLDLSLVVLLNGWNVNDGSTQDRVRAKWHEVKHRWCRELSEMSECAIDIVMLSVGDDQALRELSGVGTRLFVAL
ncbi:hypothetical protein [Sphingomonas montanisoli]|uniref:Uncharacterized protein n=1 Tax=Sphingomonas montanisoli TaxID=2606412 RepID=A0A5D9BZ79_9SPHN|nr:hypothetical protein [Sphingomonas montanisoli]TZG24898.1 hypothetical protein FYJ91_16595 [Sphingomonas montanisoli]